MKILTQEALKDALNYDLETGVFTWRKSIGNRVKEGQTAGSVDGQGYLQFGFLGKLRLAHRMAWLWVTGELPSNQIDHRNGIKTDNSFSNLRLSDQSGNSCNQKLRADNKSGHKGVSWNKKSGKWVANITVQGNQIFLGRFDDPEEAAKAVKEKRGSLHGEFCNHG